MAVAHVAHALAAQTKHLLALGPRGNFDAGAPIQRRHLDVGAERGLRQAHRHLAVQVIAIALEDGMRLQPHLHVEIARRPAAGAGFALAREPDLVALVHARRHLHR